MSVIFDFANPKFYVGFAKNLFFLTQLCSFFLKSFLHQIAEMYEFTDFISILAYASYLISVILEF